MLQITANLAIPLAEIRMHPIRSQGSGGQNVNKVSTAVHLRFDIPASSLPDECKERLLQGKDRRINQEGCLIIKAQEHRSLEKNREAALARLKEAILPALKTRRVRKPTRMPKAVKEKRLDNKTKRGMVKQLRKKVE
ncbi:MAG: hypothetical protein CSB24_02020 [Deltaproteobacteria bacterium]|nr:MAG: hypothetical protein CSB24_02020 [Deltaproteobacteria bacterium]